MSSDLHVVNRSEDKEIEKTTAPVGHVYIKMDRTDSRVTDGKKKDGTNLKQIS